MNYYGNNDYRDYLAHHGILGQRKGVRNGPPYPLGASDHSAAEKKAGWRKSLSLSGRSDREKSSQKRWIKLSKNSDFSKALKIKKKKSSISEDLKAVNPSGSQHNCMLCTAAFEMRRRGYDVVAKPSHKGFSPDTMLKMFPGADKHKSGYNVTTQKELKQWQLLAAKGKNVEVEQAVLKELSGQGVGARGDIQVRLTPTSGHSMAYEVTKTGVVFHDSQNAKTFSVKESQALLRASLGANFERLDNVEFDEKMIKVAVENRK